MACGVLGQLDIEIVHLAWELVGWFVTLWLLTKFPRNLWLWVANVVLSVHALEHLFISHTFFLDSELIFTSTQQLWATTVDGKIVTAHPVGTKEILTNFYGAGGKNGILGAGGLIAALTGASMPSRPILHPGYNALITIPTVLGFIQEARHVHNRYLERALPRLTRAQLIAATPELVREHYRAGETIVRQGERATHLFIIATGEVDIIMKSPDGRESVVERLSGGQYFGEVGLRRRGKSPVTVRAARDVELLALGHHTFIRLLGDAEESRADVACLMEERLRLLGMAPSEP